MDYEEMENLLKQTGLKERDKRGLLRDMERGDIRVDEVLETLKAAEKEKEEQKEEEEESDC